MSPRRLALLAVLALALSALPAGAAPARNAPAAGSGLVFAPDPLSHTLKVKPHKLEFREVAMTELRWKHWGTRVARARGISRILTCSPDCSRRRAPDPSTCARSASTAASAAPRSSGCAARRVRSSPR